MITFEQATHYWQQHKSKLMADSDRKEEDLKRLFIFHAVKMGEEHGLTYSQLVQNG